MRRMLVVLALLLVGCGGSDGAKPTTTTAGATTTTEDPAIAAYCRLMERTDEAMRGDDLAAAVRAENERVVNAPEELRDEYAYWTDDESGIPTEVVDRVKDWTQEHCGFLPSFG